METHPPPSPSQNSGDPKIVKKKSKNKKYKKYPQSDVVFDSHPQSVNSTSSSTNSNIMNSRSKGFRLSRNPNRVFNHRRNGGDADALALPLGMSIAAFVAQVLEKKDAAGVNMSVNHLSETALAHRYALWRPRGLTSRYARWRLKNHCLINFERSFQSTLMTLRVVSELSGNRERSYFNQEGSSNNFHFDMKDSTSSTIQEHATIDELNVDNVNADSIYNGQQLTCVPLNRLPSRVNQSSMITTFERSVSEQARSNDLKEFEIGLKMKSMKLKEAQIAVDCDSNVLEKFKVSMGIAKAKFKAEKFKTELEDSRQTQLLKKCADFLVAGLLIMLTALGYGTYIHSHQRLTEATEACNPMKESSSWWKPMASFSSGFQVLRCQVQVISRMLFGLFMIIAITYLLIQRSGTASQTMPITFLILLGFGCGLAGKLCVDTLGGSGNHWLFYWEFLCLIHFFANIWTSVLFVFLHGPVNVTNHPTSHKLFPYWFRRRVLFYPAMFVLPLLCGLIPFAGPFEWFEHFSSFLVNDMSE